MSIRLKRQYDMGLQPHNEAGSRVAFENYPMWAEMSRGTHRWRE
jgi:hypothetical protein